MADTEHRKGLDEAMETEFDGLAGIDVHVDDSKVELVILDDLEWNDFDVAIPIKYSSEEEETDLPHDIQHILIVWNRITDILIKWARQEYPDVKPWAYDFEITVVYKTMFPLSDRGKWFFDWMAETLEETEVTIRHELDDSEDARRMRQELDAAMAEWVARNR